MVNNQQLTNRIYDMPTGYTAGVQSGEIETLEAYAMGCARAFGALVMMRDDQNGAKIPDAMEPSTEYHDAAIAKAKDVLLEEYDDSHYVKMADSENQDAIVRCVKRREETAIRLERYSRMLESAENWVSPSQDHDEFKAFMVSQLKESIKWDIHEEEKPKMVSGIKWRSDRLTAAARDIEYHTTKRNEEIERCDGRNKWIADLRGALK